jgi:hypothetical protein
MMVICKMNEGSIECKITVVPIECEVCVSIK